MRSQKTGDLNLVKKINTSIVLNTIETRGPISRAQIAKDTGLNKATVSTLANDLMNDSLIYEIGTGNSNGGRKPVMLYYNNRAGFSIGIDLGVNYVLAVLTDLSGNILDTLTESLQEQSIEAAVRIIVNMISSLKDRAPESPMGSLVLASAFLVLSIMKEKFFLHRIWRGKM
ncbi:helix-turn-helix domain-containing protein [Geomicrobium sp. JCM 19039]|uniref:MarR family transcriptional regulator n=1 Tax=Geomicrobium sp. JCM 19039 TaxID=1460636 RepID=UPI001EE65EC4|nr:helix-turn-helix domain-containing protein [Geomicrobium sp. JCM 19039]